MLITGEGGVCGGRAFKGLGGRVVSKEWPLAPSGFWFMWPGTPSHLGASFLHFGALVPQLPQVPLWWTLEWPGLCPAKPWGHGCLYLDFKGQEFPAELQVWDPSLRNLEGRAQGEEHRGGQGHPKV